MKAMLTDENKNLIWTEVDKPIIKPDEILIKTKAFGVNRADLLQRSGDYPSPDGCPEWMGLEISGTVEAMGDIAKEKSTYKIGDKVCALLGGGGYAEYSAVKYNMVLPIPKGFSFEQSAGIPEVYATAYLNLFLVGNLKKEETVFIFAGASGVGIAVIQIAKAFGAKVIASVRSDEKKEFVKQIGADIAVNTKKENVVDVFKNNEINLVIDCVGGDDMGKCLENMARKGRWINIATLGGNMASINLKTMYKKALTVIGNTLRSRTEDEKASILKSVQAEIYPYFENGDFSPVIYKTFDVSDAENAHTEMMNNKNTGKIIITL